MRFKHNKSNLKMEYDECKDIKDYNDILYKDKPDNNEYADTILFTYNQYINNNNNNDKINITRVKNIPDSINKFKDVKRIERAGIIVYIEKNGVKYYALGVDRISNDYTDFSGGVGKKDGSVLKGALREFKEETLGVFGNITPEELKNFLCIYDDLTMIIFVKSSEDPMEISKIFRSRVDKINRPEVSNIVWMNKNEIVSLINGDKHSYKHMYDKIRILMSEALEKIDIFEYL